MININTGTLVDPHYSSHGVLLQERNCLIYVERSLDCLMATSGAIQTGNILPSPPSLPLGWSSLAQPHYWLQLANSLSQLPGNWVLITDIEEGQMMTRTLAMQQQPPSPLDSDINVGKSPTRRVRERWRGNCTRSSYVYYVCSRSVDQAKLETQRNSFLLRK